MGRRGLPPLGTEDETSDSEVGNAGLLRTLAAGYRRTGGRESQPPAQGSILPGKSWVYSSSWRWLKQRESESAIMQPSGTCWAWPWVGFGRTTCGRAILGDRGLRWVSDV